MKRLIFPILVVLALLLAGCVGPNLVPVGTGDPKVTTIWVDGRQAALSTAGDFSVAVSGARTENLLYLHAGFRNDSPYLTDAIPEQLTVEAVSRSGYRRYLHVYGKQEFLEKVKTEQGAALFVQALSAVTEKRVTWTHGHAYGPHGPYYWSTTTEIQGPDLHDFFRLARTAKKYERDYATFAQILLGRTTLLPGKSAEGVVAVEYDPAYAERFYVEVPFGGETHHLEFVFEQR